MGRLLANDSRRNPRRRCGQGLRLVEYCDKDQFDKLPPSFRDAELKRKVRKMGWEERAAFIELARGDMYKHMFYAARNGSKVRKTVRAFVGSATSILLEGALHA